MNTKLFIGNLPYEVSSEELKQYFAQFGAIEEAVVISDKVTGRSKGYGFVRFNSATDAQTAVTEINGKEYKGRRLAVNIAQPSKPKFNSLFH